jgi:hypothetical protein
VVSITLLSSGITTVLGLPTSFLSSNIIGAFTGGINQCIQAQLANANHNNNNNSSVAAAKTNPTFAFDNAKAYCTQLAQAYINNKQLTTQNQFSSPSLRTDPLAYQYPNQYPGSYGYQQPQVTNNVVTPSPQYPYQQSPYPYANQQQPYPYPYQQSPYPYANQQPQQPSNGASTPGTSQYPYQSSYPYQQPQNQSSSLPAGNNPNQYPYQQLPQQQNQSSALATNPPQQQSSQSFMTTSPPSKSNLIVVTQVNSTGGSNNYVNAADNFTQLVENLYTNPDGYAYVFHYMKGSETGVTLNLQPGRFAVYELNNNIKSVNPPLGQSTYDMTFSGDCKTFKSNKGGATYGYGTINLGETKTCTVTLSLHKC